MRFSDVEPQSACDGSTSPRRGAGHPESFLAVLGSAVAPELMPPAPIVQLGEQFTDVNLDFILEPQEILEPATTGFEPGEASDRGTQRGAREGTRETMPFLRQGTGVHFRSGLASCSSTDVTDSATSASKGSAGPTS